MEMDPGVEPTATAQQRRRREKRREPNGGRGFDPGLAYRVDRRVHVGVGGAEDETARRHDRVDERFTREVCDVAARRRLVIRRPLLGQEHLGPLGQQADATRNQRLGLLVEPLAFSVLHVCR